VGGSGQNATEGKLEIQSAGEKLSFIVKPIDCGTAAKVFKRAGI